MRVNFTLTVTVPDEFAEDFDAEAVAQNSADILSTVVGAEFEVVSSETVSG